MDGATSSSTALIGKIGHEYHDGFPIPDSEKFPLYQRLARTRTGLTFLLLFGIAFGVPTIFLVVWPSLFLFLSGIMPHSYYRHYIDVGIGCWIYMKAYILEKVFGIKVSVFGHKEQFSDRCLIILNHRCHFDWFFFWMVIGKMGDSTKWQVMLKSIGKVVPFFGWTMQVRNHFFLTRKWDQDERELRWKLNYLKATNAKYQILMFPEGTDFNPKSKKRSDEFADKNSLQKFHYLLQPKSTGFVYTLQTLRQYKIDAVYDLTVGYPDVLAKTELDMFKNRKIPREIHYHVKKFDVSSIPESDDGVEEWLRERWIEKEERLKLFYTHREFKDLPTDKKDKPDVGNQTTSMRFVRFFFSQLFYTGQGSFFLYLCYLHWYFIIWAVAAALWMQYITVKHNGLDYFIMRRLKDPSFVQIRDPNSKNKTEE